MNKITLGILAGVLVLPAAGFAQTLQEQISKVDSVMAAQEADAAAASAKEQKRVDAKAAAQRAVREKAKKRDQAHEDKLRDMQVEDVALDLEAKRARVKRTNDFVDLELKQKAAQTDVIQSEADSARNISSGIGENLKSAGRAEEIKAKK